jgi:hypothetical protein
VADLSYDDQNMTAPPVLAPGTLFRKGWRLVNNGTCTWDGSYALAFVAGNVPSASMGGQPVAVVGTVPPGAQYDFYANLVAPLVPGTYQAGWLMHNGQNVPFGERVWVGITVSGNPTPTPAPTQTPSPLIQFTADKTSIQAGEPVVFTWNVQNVSDVYFYAQGEDWQAHGVAGQGTQTVYPATTTIYELRVVHTDGSVETRQIRIDVTPVADAPNIARFTVDPSGQIPVGQCVVLTWDVQGNVATVTVTRNNESIWDGAPFRGSLQDCPPGTGEITYGIQATGPGGTSQSGAVVEIVAGQPTPTPGPTAPAEPVINSFTVDPQQIASGQCVNVVWNTSGAVEFTRLLRNDAVVLDNGPVSNAVQDCLTEANTYNYTLEARNNSGAVVTQQATVTVTTP